MYSKVPEARHPKSEGFDKMPTRQCLELMFEADLEAVTAQRPVLGLLEVAIERIVEALQTGHTLYLVGAGTGGRCAVLQAAELKSTFQIYEDMVQAFLSGGKEAMFEAVPGSEDDYEAGYRCLHDAVQEGDVVLGLSVSGNAPYVLGALAAADEKKAYTMALSSDPNSQIAKKADLGILVLYGPELIAGSTRMNGGTVQKLVLDKITTIVAAKLGRIRGNMMSYVDPTKAKKMAIRLFRLSTDLKDWEDVEASQRKADELLQATDYDVNEAIKRYYGKDSP